MLVKTKTKQISLTLIPIFLYLLFTPVSNVHAAKSLVIKEDFEGSLTNWAKGGDDNCSMTWSDGAPSPAGGLNLLFFKPNEATKDCAFSRVIENNSANQNKNRKVSIWFYDSKDNAGNFKKLESVIELSGKNEGKKVMHLGVRSSKNPNHYTMRVGRIDYNTNIPRSVGWHLFEFYQVDGKVWAAIDGISLKSINYSTEIFGIKKVTLISGWGVAPQAVRWDGLKLENISDKDAEIPTGRVISNYFSKTNGESEIIFESRIPSPSGKNYFNNALIALSERYPEPAEMAYSPWVLLKKEGNQYKYYGFKWNGTNKLGNPSIHNSSSYNPSVGGFTAGGSGVIYFNTTRKATTNRLPESYAQLNVNKSTVSWDNTNKELVIRTSIIFYTNFVDLRANWLNLAKPSTGERRLDAYVGADIPLNIVFNTTENIEMATKHRNLYDVTEFDSKGSIAVRNFDYSVYDKLSYQQLSSTSGGTNFKVKTKLSSIDANKIKGLYIWLDEQQPTSRRSDVAVHFGALNTPNGFKFYGRNYIDGRNRECPRQPFAETEQNCYLNYDYNEGPYNPSSQNLIWLNRDRTTTKYKTPESIAYLKIANSQISKTNSSIEVTWDIYLLPTLKNREFNVYVGVDELSGNALPSWFKTSMTHFYKGSPQTYITSQPIKTSGSKFLYGNGSEFSATGINNYQIHITLSKEEMAGYLAKMAMYNMNHLRIFTNWTNSYEGIQNVLQQGAKNGIYLNPSIFGYTNCHRLADDGQQGLETAARWMDWWIFNFGDNRYVYMYEICNDIDGVITASNGQLLEANDKYANWAKTMLSYSRQVLNSYGYNRLLTVQLHSGQVFAQNPAWNVPNPFTQLINYVDAYSTRGYETQEVNASSLMDDFYAYYDPNNGILGKSKPKPIYVGEFRLEGYKFSEYIQNKGANQKVINYTSQFTKKMKDLNNPSAHIWQFFYREDYRLPQFYNANAVWYPELHPKEWQAYTIFEDKRPFIDYNNDKAINYKDYNQYAKWLVNNNFPSSINDKPTEIYPDSVKNLKDLVELIKIGSSN